MLSILNRQKPEDWRIRAHTLAVAFAEVRVVHGAQAAKLSEEELDAED